MALVGDRGEGAKPLKAKAILVGSAEAVRAALDARAAHAKSHELHDLIGAAIVGPGELEGLPVIARAPAWEALDFSAVSADLAILAEPAPPAIARAVLKQAADAHMKVWTPTPEGLRPLALRDLVGRPLGDLDWARIRATIAGRRVLITGGGGSIGGEVARRVSGLGAARLVLLDSSELNLFNIASELPDAVLALADVRDAASVRRWFAQEKPDLVIHAAALKQVPLVEQFPCEGALTNVIGTRNVADAAAELGADLLFVSTDKAVDPSGVMGACKRLGEMYCQALDRWHGERGGPRALPVRLGNVLGSAGSVTPLFERQLAKGGPLTLTDAGMTRYFLTIPQAGDFLLQAAAIGVGGGGPRGAALVMDMGEAMLVVDLARKIIRLAGLRPELEVPITFVGLRPGEKLLESLVAAGEWRDPEPAPGVIAAASDPRGLAELREIIDRVAMLARQGADDAVKQALFAAVLAPALASEDERATG